MCDFCDHLFTTAALVAAIHYQVKAATCQELQRELLSALLTDGSQSLVINGYSVQDLLLSNWSRVNWPLVASELG